MTNYGSSQPALAAVSDVARLTSWVPIEADSPPDIPAERTLSFSWKADPRLPAPCEVHACDLGSFSRALRDAEILDNYVVALPGAVMIHSFGTRLFRRFRAIAHELHAQRGLEEQDYPLLVPPEIFEPLTGMFSLKDHLLGFGRLADFEAGGPRGYLTPTGESVIYSHWARIVRHRSDLPIRMYRCTRYFRPLCSAGQGVFKSMESVDIFEMHCCHADNNECTEELRGALAMYRELATRCGVPVLWSVRPPWGNRAQVAEVALGGDVPLPFGSTVQVGSLYQQGTRFSEPYGVRYRDADGTARKTRHVTGAISRRLVLAHLSLGMDNHGFLIHPDLAPDQVLIAYRAAGHGDMDAPRLHALEAGLTAAGLRWQRLKLESQQEMRNCIRKAVRQGVPLVVLVFGHRDPADQLRIVLRRRDTGAEAEVSALPSAELNAALPRVVEAVGHAFSRRAWAFVSKRRIEAASWSELTAGLADRRVVTSPMVISEEGCRLIAELRMGEILGYSMARVPLPCVLTGVPTRYRSIVSPRN